MNGFWQSARNFFTGREAETTTPALTFEGKSLGFEWEMSTTGKGSEEGSALLWPEASEAMETGPLAGVDYDHDYAEWSINGEYQGIEDRGDAMYRAEREAAASVIEPLSSASESYYARLADLAENRGADAERDAGRDSFDLER